MPADSEDDPVLLSEHNDPPYKRVKYEAAVGQEETTSHSSADLLSLSDDVLLMIMSHLCPQDLLHLSQTCQRLQSVTRDRTLWTTVDFRPRPISICHLIKYLSFLQPSTRFIATRGVYFPFGCDAGKVLCHIRDSCPSIETLVFENHSFDARNIVLHKFPSSLKHFAMKFCRMYGLPQDQSYFHNVHRCIPQLEILQLEYCPWLSPHSFMAISKCPNLRELRLKGCSNLGSCVAYTSMATRFGFKALEVLDVRQTYFGDSEISCFNLTGTLTHLYLECPPLQRPKFQKDQGDTESDIAGATCLCNNIVQAMRDSGEVIHSHEAGISSESEDEQLDELQVQSLISDIGISSLGKMDLPAVSLQLIIRTISHPKIEPRNPKLSHMVIRNYKTVGDISLAYLSRISSLRYLDITGTSVSSKGVDSFLVNRPDVKLVSNFNSTATS